MEILILLALLGYGSYLTSRVVSRTLTAAGQRRRRREAQHRQAMEQQVRQQQEINHIQLVNRRLQEALLQLNEAPDFRRAASWATHARVVPVWFRQRQFRRFRPYLVSHFATCLRAGQDAQTLLQSLTELVQHLGVAPFEADYIRTEAERQMARPPAAEASYEQRMAQLQREHEQRMAALRSLQGLPPEVREQLIEAEDARFRDALLQTGNQTPPA
jgi:hypothetical protein